MNGPFMALAAPTTPEPGIVARTEYIALRRGLRKVFCSDGLLVFCSPTLEANILDNAAGVILGDIYYRHVAAKAFDGRAEHAAVVSSAQRDGRLAADFWGSYLVLTISPDGSSRIERSPFGTINAYYAVEAGTLILASDASLVLDVADRRRAVNWDAVVQHMVWDNLNMLSTCLTGIGELRSGEAIAFEAPSRMTTRFIWDPWSFTASQAMIDDPVKAVEDVRSEILRCVAARLSSDSCFALDLSGGLDSSIIAAAAAKSGSKLNAITMYSKGNDGDERSYAQAMANHLAIPLEEGAPDPKGPDLLRPARAHLARPHCRSFVQETDRISLDFASRHEMPAFVNGQGGDGVFCHLQSSGPVADVIRHRGQNPGFVHTVFQVARAARCNAWDIAWKGLKKRVKGKRHDDWHADESFLATNARSASAPEGLPWPAPRDGVLPGKVEHVHAIYNSIYNMNGYARSDTLKGLFPLLSQPLVECCLRIPTWMWIGRGRSRLIARLAMERELPSKIAWRLSKGGLGQFQLQMMHLRRPLIRDMLLGGELSAAGILDRGKIEAQLSDDMSFQSNDIGRILRLCDVEAWCRS